LIIGELSHSAYGTGTAIRSIDPKELTVF